MFSNKAIQVSVEYKDNTFRYLNLSKVRALKALRKIVMYRNDRILSPITMKVLICGHSANVFFSSFKLDFALFFPTTMECT